MAQRFQKTKSREEKDKDHLDKGMIGFWIRVFIFFLGAFLIASIAWAKDQPPHGSTPGVTPIEKSSSSIRVIKKVEMDPPTWDLIPQSIEIH